MPIIPCWFPLFILAPLSPLYFIFYCLIVKASFLFFSNTHFTFFILLFYRPRFGSLAVTAQQWPRRGRRQVGADNTVLIPLVYSRSSFPPLLFFYSRTCSTIHHTYFPSEILRLSRRGRNLSYVACPRRLLLQRSRFDSSAIRRKKMGKSAERVQCGWKGLGASFRVLATGISGN